MSHSAVNVPVQNLSDIVPATIDTMMLDTLSRQLPLGLKVRSFGVKPHSTEIIDQMFNRYGFAFILRGSGHILEDGKLFRVTAPAMLRHIPGRHYHQEPDPDWDEFYVTFSPSARPIMEMAPWTMLATPVLRFSQADFMLRHFQRMFTLFKKITSFGVIDRFELEVFDLLLEALSFARFEHDFDENDAVSRLEQYLEIHYLENIDYRELATRFGVSPRHLRRLWGVKHEAPPSQYVLGLQMRQAEYLLASTDMRIGEIAGMLNFSDALYFSRKFHQHAGMSPSCYREKYHSSLK